MSDDKKSSPPTEKNLKLRTWGHISLSGLEWGAKGEPNFTLPAFIETKDAPMYVTTVRRALADKSLTLIARTTNKAIQKQIELQRGYIDPKAAEVSVRFIHILIRIN
jgi:hypothetical protein